MYAVSSEHILGTNPVKFCTIGTRQRKRNLSRFKCEFLTTEEAYGVVHVQHTPTCQVTYLYASLKFFSVIIFVKI